MAQLDVTVKETGISQTAAKLDAMAASAASAEEATTGLEKGVAKADSRILAYIESLKLQNATFGQSQYEVDLYRAKLLGATDAQVREISEIQRAISAKQKLASTTNAAGGASSNLGKNLGKIQFGQIGYQVQDLTVQLQNGTSAFVAIGQQGSQLAGAFGPGGAVIGAVIALGSAIAGMAYNAANAEADLSALEAAGRRISDLNLDTLVKMNDAQRDLADPANKQRYKEMGDEILALTQKYENQSLTTQALRDNLQKVTDDMPSWTKSTAQYNEEVSAASAKLKESLAEEAKIRSQVNGIQKQQDALYQGEIDKKRALERENKKAENAGVQADKSAAKQAERDAKELERNKKSAADYILNLQQLNMKELALIDSHEQEKLAKLDEYRKKGAIEKDQFDAARKEVALTARNERMKYYEDEARKEAEIAYERNEQIKKAQEEKNQQIATQLDALNSMYTTFGGNANNTYKTLFLASKLFAQKDAIVMQANAMMKAWASAPFPANLPAVATTALETAPLLATIATTSFSGRMQGGQVAAGDVRMVGERGPELVQFGRNGMVTPNSALGGTTQQQVVNNIYNYAGVAVTTQTNSDGSTDIFIRKDELADLLASQAGNPNSKMNRAQGGVYERRRA